LQCFEIFTYNQSFFALVNIHTALAFAYERFAVKLKPAHSIATGALLEVRHAAKQAEQ
jgi:hypothetical protein